MHSPMLAGRLDHFGLENQMENQNVRLQHGPACAKRVLASQPTKLASRLADQLAGPAEAAVWGLTQGLEFFDELNENS